MKGTNSGGDAATVVESSTVGVVTVAWVERGVAVVTGAAVVGRGVVVAGAVTVVGAAVVGGVVVVVSSTADGVTWKAVVDVDIALPLRTTATTGWELGRASSGTEAATEKSGPVAVLSSGPDWVSQRISTSAAAKPEPVTVNVVPGGPDDGDVVSCMLATAPSTGPATTAAATAAPATIALRHTGET